VGISRIGFDPIVAAGGTALHWHFGYDPNSNQNLIVDALGQRVDLAYDYLDRLNTKTYTNHAQPNLDYQMQSITFTYDGNSNMLTAEEVKRVGGANITESYNYTFDKLDRLEQVTNYDNKTIRYSYDRQGNRRSVTDPDGITTTYGYDARNRLTTAITESGTTTYEYWPDDLLRRVIFPNGTIADRSFADAYDRADRQTRIVNHSGNVADPISSFVYTYDDNGNRLSQTETHRQIRNRAAEITTYEYDLLNRLTRVVYGSNGVNGDVTYTYSPNGNRLTELGNDPVDPRVRIDRQYVYDRVNRLRAITDNVDPARGVAFDYDDNGNRISKTVGLVSTVMDVNNNPIVMVVNPTEVTPYQYGIRDELLQTVVVGANQPIKFDYNYDRMRVKKFAPANETRYLYDDAATLIEYDAGLSTTIKYDYGYQLLSLVEVNAAAGTRNSQFYLRDGLGSTSDLTNSTGAVQTSYMYDAWGDLRAVDAAGNPLRFGSSVNPKQYTGHYHDDETDLHYFGARYYDDDTSYFITQDPYQGASDTPPSLHRYLYAYANPLTYVDLTGYSPSNRQLMGLDDKSVDESLAADPSLSNVLKLTAKQTVYDVWNMLTAGFVAKHDELFEARERGEISEGAYWSHTIGQAAVSTVIAVGSAVIGGAIGGRLATAGGGLLRSLVAGAAAGAVEGGVTDVFVQTVEIAAGRREEYDLGQTLKSAGIGAAFGTLGGAAGHNAANKRMKAAGKKSSTSASASDDAKTVVESRSSLGQARVQSMADTNPTVKISLPKKFSRTTDELERELTEHARRLKSAFDKAGPEGWCGAASCIAAKHADEILGPQGKVQWNSMDGHQNIMGVFEGSDGVKRFFMQDPTFSQFTSRPKYYPSKNAKVLKSSEKPALTSASRNPRSMFSHLEQKGIAFFSSKKELMDFRNHYASHMKATGKIVPWKQGALDFLEDLSSIPSRSQVLNDPDWLSKLNLKATGSISGTGSTAVSANEPRVRQLFLHTAEEWNRLIPDVFAVPVELVVTDLPATQLGEARVSTSPLGVVTRAIVIDRDAAGVGWFVDETPDSHSEFPLRHSASEMAVDATSSAQGHYDLFTVLMHELGHIAGIRSAHAGFDRYTVNAAGSRLFVAPNISARLSADGSEIDPGSHPHDLMNPVLEPGMRRLPSALDVEILEAVLSFEPNSDLGTFHARHGIGENVWTSFGMFGIGAAAGDGKAAGVVNGGFDVADFKSDLFGWQHRGDVSIIDGRARIREDSQQISGILQTVIVPPKAISLWFTVSAIELGTDETNPPDAFEVALLNATSFESVMPNIGLTESDGFFNIQQNDVVYVSNGVVVPGVSVSGSEAADLSLPFTVEVDIRHVPAGSTLTLYFDLVGFGEVNSIVVIDDVRIITEPTPVAGRHIFYSNSAFDGNNPDIGELDDRAIASDKLPLLPGGKANFANYTSYSRGINGIMIDIPNLPGTPIDTDFEFRVGNDNQPDTWHTAPAPSGISVRSGAGTGGSDRITIVWPDGSIQKQWLQVTVKATATTGLATDDIFYWGNAIGDTGNTTLNAFVDGTDLVGVEDNQRDSANPAPIDSRYDINRDQRVDRIDWELVRANHTNFLTDLNLITVPIPAAADGEWGEPGKDASIDNPSRGVPAVSDDPPARVRGVNRPTSPWQNPANPLDTNEDGWVTPIDALLVINELNRSGSRELDSAAIDSTLAELIDVNGDSILSPIDALLVINYLNQSARQAAAVPESRSATQRAIESVVAAISTRIPVPTIAQRPEEAQLPDPNDQQQTLRRKARSSPRRPVERRTYREAARSTLTQSLFESNPRQPALDIHAFTEPWDEFGWEEWLESLADRGRT
jgi:RHS repeat-associated protein